MFSKTMTIKTKIWRTAAEISRINLEIVAHEQREVRFSAFRKEIFFICLLKRIFKTILIDSVPRNHNYDVCHWTFSYSFPSHYYMAWMTYLHLAIRAAKTLCKSLYVHLIIENTITWVYSYILTPTGRQMVSYHTPYQPRYRRRKFPQARSVHSSRLSIQLWVPGNEGNGLTSDPHSSSGSGTWIFGCFKCLISA